MIGFTPTDSKETVFEGVGWIKLAPDIPEAAAGKH
jgi:hypothetical protein